MTLTAYVAQLLGVYLVLSGVLMIVREQAMMLLVPKFVDTARSSTSSARFGFSSASRSCLRTTCGSGLWGRSYMWLVGSRFCVVLPCSCFPPKRSGKF
jgi:hypothetical protein